MATKYPYWDEIRFKVRELRSQGYTFLQIEEETGFDYEDVLWAVNQDHIFESMRGAV
jgi:hypothetical protein